MKTFRITACLVIFAVVAVLQAEGTDVCGTLSTTTWTTTGSPYVVTCSVTIPSSATLTINAGVTVKFTSGSGLLMNVYGKLTAVGTSNKKIIFTSSATTPAPGNWRSINFQPGALTGSRISYATISYGGWANYDNSEVIIQAGSPAIDHVTLNNSGSAGIRVTASSPTLDNITASTCATDGIAVQGGSATISNSTLSSNTGYGLNLIQPGVATITSSTISNNTNYAIGAEANTQLTYSGITLSNNGGGSKNAIGYRGGTINGNETWHAGIDWVLTGNPTIASSGVLIIDPGTTIKFSAGGTQLMNVYGKLTAVGTASNQIVITSTSATPGSWRSINFQPGAITGSRISYATISYGGWANYDNSEIIIQAGSPAIDHVTVNNSASAGIRVTASSPVLDTITASTCATDGIAVQGGSATISNSTLSSNTGYGLNLIQPGAATITNSTISTNTNYAIGAEANTQLTYSSITLSNNGGGSKNAIGYRGGTINGNETWHSGLDWVMTGGPGIGSTGALTIDPGTRVKFISGSGLWMSIYGRLTAVGTAASPILITSAAATPAPGNWLSIYFQSTAVSGSHISYATISYGGGTPQNSDVVINGGSPTIDHVTVNNSANVGISVTGSSTNTPVVSNCAFSANAGGGISNSAPTYPVIATLNYWNSASGPSGSGPGTGQSVSTGVNYEPWLTAAPADPQFFTSVSPMNTTFNPPASINFTLDFQTSGAGNWTVTFKNSAGTTVRTFTESGSSGGVIWNGTDGSGTPLPNGTYTYLIESTTSLNQSAAPATGRTTIDTNSQVTISGPTVAPAFFSPNSDGVQDTTLISATSLPFDTVSWTLNIRNGANNIIKSTTAQGKNFSYTWDGKDSGGTIQPDGPYTIETVASAGTQTQSRSGIVTVDDTVPTTIITSPANNATIFAFQQPTPYNIAIVGTASDANIANWYVEKANGNPPGTFTQIATGTTSVVNGTIANWNVQAVSSGTYTIRVRVVDKAGNTTSTSIAITLWSFSQSLSATQFNASTGGTVTFTSNLATSVTETLAIRNEAGTIVRTLVNGSRAAGTYNDVWNGRDAQGALLPDGGYFAVETLTSGSTTTVYDPANQENWRASTDFAIQAPPLTAYDPFKNSPLVITYNFDRAGRNIVAFTPYQYDTFCDPPVFCAPYLKYEEAGPHTVTWAGIDNTGALRTDIHYLLAVSYGLPLNAVVIYGTKPSISNFSLSPLNFSPNAGMQNGQLSTPMTQTISFAFSSYQSQPSTLKVEFENTNSLSTLRTITQTGVIPGSVSIQWDGRADNGDFVAPGTYVVTATVIDPIGNQVSQKLLTIVSY